MSKKQETIADIIADMRKRCFPYAKSEDSGARYVAYLGYQEFPDRIEAAWNRERVEVREIASTTIIKESVQVANARHRRDILDFCNVYCMVYPPGDPDVPVVLQCAFQNFCDELVIEQVKLGESEASHDL